MDQKEVNAVVAIDFGTCNTRMAFANKPSTNSGSTPDSPRIVVMNEWECAVDAVAAPTSIIISQHRARGTDPYVYAVTAYGYEAEEMFLDPDLDKTDKPLLFKNFKMALHEKEAFSENHNISAINGGSLPAIDIFSLALEYLSEKMLKYISEKVGIVTIRPRNILWVLTVPAIWKPGARQFMRQAAYKAGLCEPCTREKLIIALEPECAALHVRSEEAKHGSGVVNSSHYGVVDCGGGTIDIAYHSLEDRKEGAFVVNELAPPSGGPYGGTRVDKAFEELLEPVFGNHLSQPFFEQLKLKYPDAWLSFTQQLEKRKTVLGNKADDEFLWFDIRDISLACKEITGRDAYTLLSASSRSGITLSKNNRMQVRVDLMKALYNPSIDAICKCLNKDLATQRLSEVSTLYMVGSFSKSSHLLQSVRQNTRSAVESQQIFNPPDSPLAVVKGAVMYGINPSIVQERVSARSYGFCIRRDFDAAKDPSSKAEFINGRKMCNDVYDEFLQCGQTVCNVSEIIKKVYLPVEPHDTSMGISVYSAEDTVEYVDEKGCQNLANITVKMPDLRGGTDREVVIEIEFDGPEIHVVARDGNTDKTFDASLDFWYEKRLLFFFIN